MNSRIIVLFTAFTASLFAGRAHSLFIPDLRDSAYEYYNLHTGRYFWRSSSAFPVRFLEYSSPDGRSEGS